MAGYSLEACAAGLAGVRGQLELARALREVHTQEVRQELAQFEAVSSKLAVFSCSHACGSSCVWNSGVHHSFMFSSCGSVVITHALCKGFLSSSSANLEACMLSFESRAASLYSQCGSPLQDSVEAEVMTAAQARIGEGPLRAAEGKEPKALQSEVAHLMNICEKLRARKRFFANKVEEINNPKANARPPPHGPGSSPNQPLDDAGAGAAQPLHELAAGSSGRPHSAAPSLTSFPNHTPRTSVSPPPADQLIESWVVTPPATPAVTPPPSPPATTSNPDASDPDHSNHGTGKADATNDAAAVSSIRLTSDGRVTADTHGAAASDYVTVQEAGTSLQVRQESQHAQHHTTSTSSREAPPAANETSVAQQHGSRPASGLRAPKECHHEDVSQQCNRRPIGLTWADGVRAPMGMALAIGPWAHTSSSALPVTTQAIQHDVISLASSSGQAHMAGSGPHDRDAAAWEGGLSCIGNHGHEQVLSQHASASAPAAHEGMHDQVMQAGHAAAGMEAAAATATEAVREAQTRATTPDDDSSSSQMCNVCLCPIRQLIIVLQPCGHYYCENCTAAIRAAACPRCPECRTRISSTFRVPLSSAQTQTHKEDAQHAQVTLQHCRKSASDCLFIGRYRPAYACS